MDRCPSGVNLNASTMARACSGVSTCGITMPSAPPSRQRVASASSPAGTRTSGAMPASSAATEIEYAVSTEVGPCSRSMNSQSKPAVFITLAISTPRTARTPIPIAMPPFDSSSFAGFTMRCILSPMCCCAVCYEIPASLWLAIRALTQSTQRVEKEGQDRNAFNAKAAKIRKEEPTPCHRVHRGYRGREQDQTRAISEFAAPRFPSHLVIWISFALTLLMPALGRLFLHPSSFISPPSSLHFFPSSAFLGAKQRVDHAHALHRVFHAVGQRYFAANRARKRFSLQSVLVAFRQR